MVDRFGSSLRALSCLRERAVGAALLLVAGSVIPAHAQVAFDDWLAAFRQDAAAQGISAATLDAAFADVRPVERAIELDRRQPEFMQTFSDYLARRVTATQLARGQAALAANAGLFDAVEAQYGVPKTVLAAFWGLETQYGTQLGGFNIPASLATLAHDGRRSAFFRGQLLDALRIVDAGHVAAADMKGSWAGAMGHMQFMPTTFRAYARDADGDGRIDLWRSLPDALYSAANYLNQAGWRSAEPIAVAVRLPQDFDWRRARVANRLPLADWVAAGVAAADGGALPAVAGRSAIVLPQGWQGPAFMVFDNFDVVMQWNRSVNYALAVAQLGERLAGGSGVMPAGEPGALSTAQLAALQQSLNELGFDAGTPDGLLGPLTQSAIRRYQVVHGLPADAYPAPSVFAHVEQTHAAVHAAGHLAQGAPPSSVAHGSSASQALQKTDVGPR